MTTTLDNNKQNEPSNDKKVIVITGGTGLLGSHISPLLRNKGYEVRHLSRKENLQAEFPAYKWDLQTQQADPRAFKNVYGIIHLAGAGIADGRWTDARKKVIRDSRVLSSQLLYKSIQALEQPPNVFVACSAIGYYGSQTDHILTEEAPAGNDFMSKICVDWEASVAPIQSLGIRTPIIRVGIVLSTKGGALPKLKMSYPFRIGNYFGDGQQYYAWVHIDDISRLFIYALEQTKLDGIYNGTAPSPVTNKALAQAISKAYDQKTLLLPVPSFAPRAIFGEMADVVLNSTRAVPKTTQETGFEFEHPDLIPALRDVLGRRV